jgi:hypothetical protein
MTTQKTMSVAKLFHLFTPTEQTVDARHTWDTEAAWLYTNHTDRMAKLRASIAKLGIEEPIRLCYGNPTCCHAQHVVDGHHRAVLARDMGLKRVPVADAWDGTDWFTNSW